ncbi:hypothetical protein F6U00_003584 [Enterobacter hormaechei]|nr:hypothetical protein [Enterobacter hormaechei]
MKQAQATPRLPEAAPQFQKAPVKLPQAAPKRVLAPQPLKAPTLHPQATPKILGAAPQPLKVPTIQPQAAPKLELTPLNRLRQRRVCQKLHRSSRRHL